MVYVNVAALADAGVCWMMNFGICVLVQVLIDG